MKMKKKDWKAMESFWAINAYLVPFKVDHHLMDSTSIARLIEIKNCFKTQKDAKTSIKRLKDVFYNCAYYLSYEGRKED